MLTSRSTYWPLYILNGMSMAWICLIQCHCEISINYKLQIKHYQSNWPTPYSPKYQRTNKYFYSFIFTEKECLYKHWNSTYNDRSGMASPQAPTPIRAMHPPSRPSSRASSRPPSAPPQTDGLSIAGFRAPSVGSVRECTASVKKPYRPPKPAPRSAWAARLAATNISVPHYTPGTVYPQNTKITVDDAPVPGLPVNNGAEAGATAAGRPRTSASSTAGSRRSQSATSRRARFAPPPRPTKSAGSHREPHTSGSAAAALTSAPSTISPKPMSPALKIPTPSTEAPAAKPPSPPPSPPMSPPLPCPSLSRPDAPGPPGEDDENESVAESSPESLDYEEQLDKYGWRFEIPGDPLGLK